MLSMQSTKGTISKIRTSVIRVGQLRRNRSPRLSQLSTPTDSFLSDIAIHIRLPIAHRCICGKATVILRQLLRADNRDSCRSTGAAYMTSESGGADTYGRGRRTRLAQTYYDLATMLDAGVPILRSFDILIEGREGYAEAHAQPSSRIRVQRIEPLRVHGPASQRFSRPGPDAHRGRPRLPARWAIPSRCCRNGMNSSSSITRRMLMGYALPVLHVSTPQLSSFRAPALVLGEDDGWLGLSA